MVQTYQLKPPSIIVDDSDPAIRYHGTWSSPNSTIILSAGFSERMPNYNTLHVLQVFDGSFSYDFTGIGISIFATPYDNSGYTVQCFVDGNQLNFNASATKAQFGRSRPVCQAYGLPDNMVHTISVNVSVPPRQQQDASPFASLSGFAFDYMLIQPPSGTSPWNNGNQDVLVSVLDNYGMQNGTDGSGYSALVFPNDNYQRIADVAFGWDFDPENGFSSRTPGAAFNVTFTGTSLWWYGYFQHQNGSIPYPTFSVDGGPPVEFAMWALCSSQQFKFRTPIMAYGRHLLTVVHGGNSVAFPTTLQSLIIQKSTSTVSSSAVGSPSPTIITKPGTSAVPTKHKNLGGIVGGVSGGVVFLLLVVGGVWILIRSTRRRRRNFAKTAANSPTLVAEPFPISPGGSALTLVPRKAQQNIDNAAMLQGLQAPPMTKWTRRHTISDGAGGMPTSITTRTPEQVAGLRISLPPMRGALQLPRTHTDPVIERPVAQIGDTLYPATQNEVIISDDLRSVPPSRREAGWIGILSAPDLPPLYTPH